MAFGKTNFNTNEVLNKYSKMLKYPNPTEIPDFH